MEVRFSANSTECSGCRERVRRMTWTSRFSSRCSRSKKVIGMIFSDLLAMYGLRRIHRECRETLDSLLTAMSGDALLVELSEGPRLTNAQFDRLTAGSLWYSLVSSLDKRDPGGLPVRAPPFSGLELPFKARFQMTVFGSLVLKLYITLVFIREGDLAKLTAEAARARQPVSGRLQKPLRSDYVR